VMFQAFILPGSDCQQIDALSRERNAFGGRRSDRPPKNSSSPLKPVRPATFPQNHPQLRAKVPRNACPSSGHLGRS
jgi:hypothetical protein